MSAVDLKYAEALSRAGYGSGPHATPAQSPAATPLAPAAARPPRVLGSNDADVGRTSSGEPVGIDLARLIDGRLLIQGNSGAGKSMLLRRLFEESFGRVQQLLLDPDGEFSTLAEILDVAVISAADARRVGTAALAAHIREHRYSAVLDLSDATAGDRLDIVAGLAEGLIAAPPQWWQPLVVLVDEAQTLAPHYDPGDVDPDTRKRAISALADLMGRGRKRGLAGVIATQRLAETAKAVVAKATNIIVGRTIFDRDLERAGAFLGFTAGHAKALRTLDDGEFIAIGPAIAGPRRVRFRAGLPRSRHKGTRPELVAPPSIEAARTAELIRALPTASPTAQSPRGPDAPTRGSGRGRGWTEQEDRIVQDSYAANLPIREIQSRLIASGFKARAISGISARANDLGLRSLHAAAQWTDEEDRVLAEAYARDVRIIDIVTLLAESGFERGRVAIQMRAIALGITRDRVNYWTEPEKAIAIEGLSSGKPYREIVEELRQAGFHRGLNSILKFAQKNNFSRAADPWTAQEIETLRQRYAEKVPVRAIAEELGKPQASIRTKASHLGFKQRVAWSEEERRILSDAHAGGELLIDAAAKIGRPYPNVAAEAGRMGLAFRKSRRAG